ncbi:glutathione S-transferase family protein [Marinobacterium sp. D7]|uniref:glutathione S-transferase family protein n=1 Tax=Marinobacterium ramblicola TaxID=2849041 RepID=UPI001C2DCDDF|nr:glutathione S-transferase family protein [Marinobacterium ramblicola]MBV1788709.1 glutathione S-transferase family protein [Marinobacterium ramblicola]
MNKLYGSLYSRAHRTAWMLKELGVEFEHEPVNFMDGSTHTPEFLKINPNGRVPAYESDGLCLFESLAINLYLARKHDSPLSPANIEEDALMTQWTHWVITEIEKPLLLAAANLILFDEDKRSPAELKIALKKLARPLGVLNQHLSDRRYLVAERFTVADLNVSAVMTLARLAALDMSAWPNVDRWLEACLERPAAADWKVISFKIPRPETDLGVLAMFV